MSEDKGDAGGSSLSAAKDQLNLILGFFPRVDTKLSVVLGVDVGMLGLLMSNAPKHLDGIAGWTLIALALFFSAIMLSLHRLYRGSFPNVDNKNHSLVFFRDIAKMAPDDFVRDFTRQSVGELSDAVLRQAWRNAKILDRKFDDLKSAYRATCLGIPPWLFCLYVFMISAQPQH